MRKATEGEAMRRPKEASRGEDGEVTSLSAEVARATLGKTGGGEGSGRAVRGGAHEVQWRGGEAVSDIF